MLVQLHAFLFFPNSSQQISDPKLSCLLGGASARRLTGTSDNFTPAVCHTSSQKVRDPKDYLSFPVSATLVQKVRGKGMGMDTTRIGGRLPLQDDRRFCVK